MTDDVFKEEFKRFKKSHGEFPVGEIIDFECVESFGASQICVSNLPASSSACEAAQRLGLLPLDKWKVFTLAAVPGLCIIPNPFQEGGQHHWVKQCLVTYPCKPNVCNLDAHIVRSGDGRLWPKDLNDLSSTHYNAADALLSKGGQEASKDVSEASDLLHKLRWVTLGYHYDWTAKVYYMEHRSPFPEDLAKLSTFILDVAGFPNFVPEAAIVNYYNLGSTLSGHTDHSEKDLSHPLISISFGQSAVFLIGGATKQVKPKAILVRSGDVIIMSGPCRLAYHGIPKIIPPSKGMEIPSCLSQRALQQYLEAAQRDDRCLCGKVPAHVAGPENTEAAPCVSCGSFLSSWKDFAEYISSSRINVNIRQVVSH